MSSMLELGEKGFLQGLLPMLSGDALFLNGFGHDVSILDLGLEKYLAFKIDRAPSPVALKRGLGDHKTWGRLAVVANVSDLLASAAIPKALMLSMVAPGSYDSEAMRDIVLGCQESCVEHNIAFVGGDTKEGPAVQVIGAAVGLVNKDYYLGRKVATPGDHLIVAGRLGGFAGAQLLLDSGLDDPHRRSELVSCLTIPKARVAEAAYMRQVKLAHGSCDLSDGLYDALSIFCANGTGITINEGKLPLHVNAVDAALALGLPACRFAFAVGDWAIAYLVSETALPNILENAPPGLELFDIGRFNDSGLKQMEMNDGHIEPLPSIINEHFRNRLEDGSGYLGALLGKPLL